MISVSTCSSGRVRPVRILLVEDNPADVYLIQAGLCIGEIKKQIDIVHDGAEALEYLEHRGPYVSATRPDLVILDLNLPKIDGRAVLEIVKSDAGLKQIPVVVLSTSASEDDVFSAYEHHANCYLTKPTGLDEFLDVVRSIEDYWLSFVALPIM